VTRLRDHYRPLRPGADSGSIPLVVLLTIAGVGLSLLLATTVYAQQRTTRFDVRRAHALNAAQTGIDVAVSTIRAAIKSDGSGDPAKLPPCDTALAGPVSQGAAAAYSVKIYYLSAKPPSGDVTWAANPSRKCKAPYRYALIESTGNAQPGTPARTLVATYVFSTVASNPNIPGGLIRVYRPSGGTALCLAADSAQPNNGDDLRIAVCDPTSPRQKFSYEVNLNLVLAASRSQSDPRGMCVYAPPSAGAVVEFRGCTATTSARQQWGQNDYSAFQGTSDGVNLNNLCINLTTPVGTGSAVVLRDANQDQNACFVAWSENKTFFPDASVGTGMAGPATKQLVNYSQFSRCIDVPENNPDLGYVIVFPCKQQPNGSVLWNQTWNLPSIPSGPSSTSGPIHTKDTSSGITHCLTSQGPNTYPSLTPCNPAVDPLPANLTWTYRVDSGMYSDSYRIESTYLASSAHCLTPTDPTAPPPATWETWDKSLRFSKVMLTPCTNSELQKWNASPTIVKSALTDVVER
jgi:hypothetical protein